MPITVTKSGHGLAGLKRAIERLKNREVLVGIPAQNSIRQDAEVNNATLLYLHTHGSELAGIPPRPVLDPSINANQSLITPHLAAAAHEELRGAPEQSDMELRKAGMVAANAAKRWFTDSRNNWAPNSPETIARKGSSRPLIDTGSLRRAITFVLRQSK